MKKKNVILFFLLAIGLAVGFYTATRDIETESMETVTQANEIIREEFPKDNMRAIFAGGCFWCIEAVFQETRGVSNAISGYAGGTEHNPTYEEVYKETTGHREALMVYYDPEIISYEELLDIFWRSIDPTDDEGQFVDKGFSYTTAIFYESSAQKAAAENSLKSLDESGRFDEPIVTEIIMYSTFYEAEDYHQDYYIKSPNRYKSYENASGRQEYKDQVWQAIESGSYN